MKRVLLEFTTGCHAFHESLYDWPLDIEQASLLKSFSSLYVMRRTRNRLNSLGKANGIKQDYYVQSNHGQRCRSPPPSWYDLSIDFHGNRFTRLMCFRSRIFKFRFHKICLCGYFNSCGVLICEVSSNIWV